MWIPSNRWPFTCMAIVDIGGFHFEVRYGLIWRFSWLSTLRCIAPDCLPTTFIGALLTNIYWLSNFWSRQPFRRLIQLVGTCFQSLSADMSETVLLVRGTVLVFFYIIPRFNRDVKVLFSLLHYYIRNIVHIGHVELQAGVYNVWLGTLIMRFIFAAISLMQCKKNRQCCEGSSI